jgi:protease-4
MRYADEVESSLSPGDDNPQKVYASEYARVSPSAAGVETGPRMALIYCSGTILGGDDRSDPVMGSTLGAGRVIRDIRRATASRSIKAIILRIDSPGGSGLASENIWRALTDARQEKPVVASISDLGASGGYMIAIGADTILAHAGSLVGSIGVFAGKFDNEGQKCPSVLIAKPLYKNRAACHPQDDRRFLSGFRQQGRRRT